MTEIEQIADEAEYEARKLIPTSDRVITSRDVAMIAARLALSAQASRVAELEGEVARLTKECEEAFSEGYGCGANNAAQ